MDQSQLRELLGDAELRELLDAESMDAVERQLQRLDSQYHVRSADGVHDMLLVARQSHRGRDRGAVDDGRCRRERARAGGRAARASPCALPGNPRFIAVEDAARVRDALGVPLPVGIPESLLQPVRDPLGDLALRFARTHTPFTAADFAMRYGLGTAAAESVLTRLALEGRLVEGEFRPGGTRREWTDAGVLRMLRRRSLAKLRHEVEAVDQAVLGRFATTWQGIVRRRTGADALLDAIEQLQGAPLPASILETEVLPARIDVYDPADLDAVTAAGEVVWVGVEPLGERDGRVALYLADHLPRLLAPASGETSGRARRDLRARNGDPRVLRERGASFFGPLHDAVGGGYPNETVDALWNLVWRGLITNDTFHALRAFTRAHAPRRRAKAARRPDVSTFRSRRLAPPSAEGRWALRTSIRGSDAAAADRGRESGAAHPANQGRESAAHASRKSIPDPASRASRASARAGGRAAGAALTRWAAAVTQQLLARHGVLTREAVAAESIPGGFGVVYRY